MMLEFREREPLGPTRATADVAGSAQLSDVVWDRWFVADLGDGRYDACVVSTFLVDANHAEPDKGVLPGVELRIAHVLCTDPSNPDGSELDTSDVDSSVLVGRPATDEVARERCARWNPAFLSVGRESWLP